MHWSNHLNKHGTLRYDWVWALEFGRVLVVTKASYLGCAHLVLEVCMLISAISENRCLDLSWLSLNLFGLPYIGLHMQWNLFWNSLSTLLGSVSSSWHIVACICSVSYCHAYVGHFACSAFLVPNVIVLDKILSLWIDNIHFICDKIVIF